MGDNTGVPPEQFYTVRNILGLTRLLGVEVRSIVEVGVATGGSARQWRRFLPEAELYLVDPWAIYEDYFPTSDDGNFESTIGVTQEECDATHRSVVEMFADDPRTHVIRAKSVDAAASWQAGQVDLVFIDGSHYFKHIDQDIAAWRPLVRDGGVLCGHDTLVWDVLAAVMHQFGQDWFNVGCSGGVWFHLSGRHLEGFDWVDMPYEKRLILDEDDGDDRGRA